MKVIVRQILKPVETLVLVNKVRVYHGKLFVSYETSTLDDEYKIGTLESFEIIEDEED